MMRSVVIAIFLVSIAACASRKELPPGAGYEKDDRPRNAWQTSYSVADGGGSDDEDGANGGSGNDPNGGPGGGYDPNGYDAGAFSPNGAPPRGDPHRVCTDLSTCCAKPKTCEREVFACQGVAMTNDEKLCQAVLDFYEIVGCQNGFNVGAQILPGFGGCIPKPGGGFY